MTVINRALETDEIVFQVKNKKHIQVWEYIQTEKVKA